MPKGTPTAWEALASICDANINFNVAQAATFLNCSQNKLSKLVGEARLHPVKVGNICVFARSDLERQRSDAHELELVKRFQRGDHPIDVYIELDGVVPLGDVERALHAWAKLTGIWLVEGPRGSYARWLQRFNLVRVSPKGLRRFIEAMLVESGELGQRVRAYFETQNARTSSGETRKLLRGSGGETAA